MSQADLLLQMLRDRPQGITAIEALMEAGSFRAAARISDLRAAGHDIETRMVRTANGKRIGRYVLR